MIELKGKFETAKVFTDTADGETISQIYDLLSSNLAINSKIRIMPDTHAGKGNVIGLTMTLHDKVAPSLVGSDIGCGVLHVAFETSQRLDLSILDENIRNLVPYGFRGNDIDLLGEQIKRNVEYLVKRLRFVNSSNMSKVVTGALRSIGTLGGGNHFIEVGQSTTYNDDTENSYLYHLIIHTGSRTLGGMMYKHYESLSQNEEYNRFIREREATISVLKKTKQEHMIADTLKTHKEEFLKTSNIDKTIKYLTGKDMEDYLHDIAIVQQFAKMNRDEIANKILFSIYSLRQHAKTLKLSIDKPHNYVDVKRGILRKGAQSGEKGEMVLIPINMKDGTIIGVAKGEEDWNYSAPHGAGRLKSRTQAVKEIDLDAFKEEMKGIYSSTIGEETLDEAPGAYKPINEILNNISGNIDVLDIIKPIYNFKGGKEYEKRDK